MLKAQNVPSKHPFFYTVSGRFPHLRFRAVYLFICGHWHLLPCQILYGFLHTPDDDSIIKWKLPQINWLAIVRIIAMWYKNNRFYSNIEIFQCPRFVTWTKSWCSRSERSKHWLVYEQNQPDWLQLKGEAQMIAGQPLYDLIFKVFV